MEEFVKVQKKHHHDVSYVDLDQNPKPEVVDYLKASVLCDSAFIKNTTDGKLILVIDTNSISRDLHTRLRVYVR